MRVVIAVACALVLIAPSAGAVPVEALTALFELTKNVPSDPGDVPAWIQAGGPTASGRPPPPDTPLELTDEYLAKVWTAPSDSSAMSGWIIQTFVPNIPASPSEAAETLAESTVDWVVGHTK